MMIENYEVATEWHVCYACGKRVKEFPWDHAETCKKLQKGFLQELAKHPMPPADYIEQARETLAGQDLDDGGVAEPGRLGDGPQC